MVKRSRFSDQISCADIIVLTKPDLAGPAGVAAARALIAAEAPPPLPALEVAAGTVDPRVILGLGAAAEDDLDARPSHHDTAHDHDHEDFESIVGCKNGLFKNFLYINEKTIFY